jgi:uncharacterized protein (TIGR03435 family)
MRPEEQDIAIALKCLLPSDEQTEQACGRVSERLQSTTTWEGDERSDGLFSTADGFPWQRTLAITVAGFVLLIISVAILRHTRSGAIEGSRIVRSSDRNEVVNMSDGSQIEMRAHSEIALENADDGLRARLNDGGIIIHAAKQRHGHLYVQTKDVIVSVTGTVFFVSAETSGSRVAVIEGSVQVQQGTQTTELTAGKQFSTNATLRAVAIEEEISWSPRASEYLALLAAPTGQEPAIQPIKPAVAANSNETGTAFEVASIHVAAPGQGGGRGGGQLACGGDIQVEPRRFIANAVTLYRLIAIAYGKDCIFLELNGDLLQGGPDWARSDGFSIQALMPEGSPEYTRAQLSTGNVPVLQKMILALLADRFKLVMRTTTKEMPVYSLLSITGATKLVPWKEGQPPRGMVGVAGGQQRSFHIIGGKKSMTDLAIQLEDATRQTVLDRTGITGEFNYDIQYAPVGSQVGAETDGLSGPSLFTAIQEQLGLKLEATRAPVQVMTIDRAQRPSEN